MNNLKELSTFLGEQKAKEALKLIKNCDKYLSDFKVKLNKLLEPADHEVYAGIAFKRKAKGEEIDGNKN